MLLDVDRLCLQFDTEGRKHLACNLFLESEDIVRRRTAGILDDEGVPGRYACTANVSALEPASVD
jgi:hypothetical protein